MSLLSSIGGIVGGGLIGGPIGALAGGLLGNGLGGKGPDNQTITNAPWAAQQPFLTYGFDQARNLYNQGAPLTPGFTQQSQIALNDQFNRGQMGSPLNDAAQSGLMSTINGNYLYGGPGFNAAYQAAADKIIPQVDSQFAGSGRLNSGLAETAKTQALGNAFAGLYGQERNNQMQALGMAPQQASQDYADIAAERDAGQARDTMLQQQAMDPWTRLQLYQGSVGGNYGGSQTTPITSNPLGGLLGGAIGGGSLFGVPGAIGGGLLGLLAARR